MWLNQFDVCLKKSLMMSSTVVLERFCKTICNFKPSVSFTWRIEKFTLSSLPYLQPEPVKVWGNLAIQLQMCTDVNETGTVLCVKPNFCFFSIAKERDDLPVEIKIECSRGGAQYKEAFSYPFNKFLTIQPNNDFIYQSGVANYLENGDLVLFVKVNILLYQDSPAQNLFFDDKQLSDFTIHVSDKSFKVHKAILAHHSSVFTKMFLSDFEEKRTNETTVEDTTTDAFQDFLQFIYNGKVSAFDRNGKELLALADKYDLQDLKKLCQMQLLASITEDNAGTLFQIAHLYQCDDLKNKAFELLKTTFAKHNFSLTEDYFENPRKLQTLTDSLIFLKSEILEAEIADVHMD